MAINTGCIYLSDNGPAAKHFCQDMDVNAAGWRGRVVV
jgi:hypothetical protein